MQSTQSTKFQSPQKVNNSFFEQSSSIVKTRDKTTPVQKTENIFANDQQRWEVDEFQIEENDSAKSWKDDEIELDLKNNFGRGHPVF